MSIDSLSGLPKCMWCDRPFEDGTKFCSQECEDAAWECYGDDDGIPTFDTLEEARGER